MPGELDRFDKNIVDLYVLKELVKGQNGVLERLDEIEQRLRMLEITVSKQSVKITIIVLVGSSLLSIMVNIALQILG